MGRYKDIFGYAFMVEELLHWLVAYLHGGHELVEQGVEQGIEQRLAAERDLLCRQAARHFDAGTVERLRALLDDVSDQEAFDEILAAIFERTTPAELLARTMQARRRDADRSPAGRG